MQWSSEGLWWCCMHVNSTGSGYLHIISSGLHWSKICKLATSTLSSDATCGTECFNASVVSQGMVLYNKVHLDITWREQAERQQGVKFQIRHVITVVGIYSLSSVNVLYVFLSSSPWKTHSGMNLVCMSDTEGNNTSQNATLTDYQQGLYGCSMLNREKNTTGNNTKD